MANNPHLCIDGRGQTCNAAWTVQDLGFEFRVLGLGFEFGLRVYRVRV